MNAVVRLSDLRRKVPFLHFTRPELNRLLGLYSASVAKGEWRDYAINQGPEGASFMVFRHSHENPLFVISKMGPGAKARTKTYNPRQGQYLVTSRQLKLSQGHSLEDVLEVFDRPIKLVSS